MHWMTGGGERRSYSVRAHIRGNVATPSYFFREARNPGFYFFFPQRTLPNFINANSKQKKHPVKASSAVRCVLGAGWPQEQRVPGRHTVTAAGMPARVHLQPPAQHMRTHFCVASRAAAVT